MARQIDRAELKTRQNKARRKGNAGDGKARQGKAKHKISQDSTR